MAEKKTTTKKTAKKVIPVKKVTKKTATKKPVSKKVVAKKEIIKKKTTAKKVTKKTVVKKSNPAKFIKINNQLGLFARFIAVFTPYFLEKLNNQESQGKSWGFWFLSNFFLVLILGITFFIAQSFFFANFPNNIVDKIPGNQQIKLDDGQTFNIKNLIQNFSLSLDTGYKLTSNNIPDPFVIVANEESVEFHTSLDQVDEKSAEFVFILDTKNALDLKNSARIFNNFIYILENETIFYDGGKNKLQVIEYEQMIDETVILPQTVDYSSIIKAKRFVQTFAFVVFGMIMFLLYFFLVIIRLISSVFWALVFWAVGAIVNVKNWDFERSFIAMLHFSFVTMLFTPLALVLNISIFWYSFALFGILFGMNFWNMKNKSK